MVGPLMSLLNTAPTLARASAAMMKIESLGLSITGPPIKQTGHLDSPSQWRRLELKGVTHTYHGEDEDESFTLGPLDLALLPADIVFITGGNGSGKTTFVKLLSGLYTPEAGEIRLDGEPITEQNIDDYRQLFSVIFSDFYLFESLKGFDIEELDAKVNEYLAQLQLNKKLKVKDGRLSTVDLSQGQRKRLALLTAYLEDRPVYVFDEWAADQDPKFKETFYHALLPELKQRGKTVLVITHDDRYYDVADRIIKLDYGRVDYDRRLKQPHYASLGIAGT
jgi:putative ATP-binding cassette transporter